MTPVPVSVAQLHQGVRSHLSGLLTRIGLVWAAAGVASLLVTAWVLAGRGGWGAGSPVPLVLDATAVALLVWGGLRYRRARTFTLDEREVSAAMERAARVPDGLLQGAIELDREIPRGVSSSLAGRSQAELAARIVASPAELAGELGRRAHRRWRRGVGLAGVMVPLAAALAAVNPGRAGASWGGLLSPVAAFTGPALPALVVEPGNAEVRRGGAVRVTVRAPLRTSVTVHWQAAGDVARSVELPVEGDSVVHSFPEVSGPVTYWAVAPDGGASDRFRLTPVDPLFVTDVSVRLDFPSYLDRPAEEFRGDIPPLQVPVGTSVGLQGRASRSLSSAALTLEGEPAVDLPVDEASFEGRFSPGRGGEYRWFFLDQEGDPAVLLPPPLLLTLVPDSAPRVRVALPARDTLLPGNLRQPLVLEASDDHGLRTLELVAWRVTALGDTVEPVAQSVDLGGTRSALARPLLDVSRWGLLPGDQVRYFARVRDIHPSGQWARTEDHVLRMPTAEELRRRAQGRLESAADRLREMQDEAARTAEETRNLERASRAPDRSQEEQRAGRRSDEASFQEQESVRQALEDQRALTEQADSLSAELSEMAEALREAGAADAEFSQDLEELQELLRELGGDDLQERLEELLSRMDELGSREAQQTLEELAQQQEQFQEQLEEALERAQRAAVEQEFRNTTSEAEELAEEQRALAESMADGSDPELRSEQQEALAEEAGELQSRMDGLAERLQELGEQAALERLGQAQESGQEARERMQQAAREAGDRQSGEAARSAEDGAEAMEQAAQELRQAQQQMMAERAQAFQDALEQTTQDALALAREQLRVQEAAARASSEEMADLRGDVSAVQQGLRTLAENLAMASRLAGADDRAISGRMGEAMAALEQTIQSMERQRGAQPTAAAAAEQAVAALNQVAVTAMAATRAMQENAESAQPSAEQMMEQMEQLAQQQADVNNQAAQMMPMQLTPQAMQELMEQLAQDQQQVASDLGQMSNQEGDEGPLGDLEALAEEAEALAAQLTGGRLDAETRERQERLFHRLLDAGRSLEREEESTERESEAPGAFERGDVGPLDAGDLGLARFRLPDAAALNRLPPAARALVLQYFQRLNRGGGGGS